MTCTHKDRERQSHLNATRRADPIDKTSYRRAFETHAFLSAPRVLYRVALQALDLSGGGGVGSGGLLGSGAGAAVGGAMSGGMGGGLRGAGGGLPPLGGGMDDDDAEAEGMESPVQFVCVALRLPICVAFMGADRGAFRFRSHIIHILEADLIPLR